MKTLFVAAVLMGLGLVAGCASWNVSPTPAYTEEERDAQIGRNWTLEWQELADDTDHALLLRPSNTLTQWNVYHRE